MLCDRCSHIHLQPFNDCPPSERWLPPARLRVEQSVYPLDPAEIHVYYFHHPSLAAFKASAKKGCHFCVMLWHYHTTSEHSTDPRRARSPEEDAKVVYFDYSFNAANGPWRCLSTYYNDFPNGIVGGLITHTAGHSFISLRGAYQFPQGTTK